MTASHAIFTFADIVWAMNSIRPHRQRGKSPAFTSPFALAAMIAEIPGGPCHNATVTLGGA